MTASWNGATLADSDATVVVEGNHYFPSASLDMSHLTASDHRTHCPWKGEAYYYDVTVNGETNENAAWYYPQPKEKAAQIEGYVAFWKGVKVSE